MLVSYMGTSLKFVIQLPADESRKAVREGPYIWAPATQTGDPEEALKWHSPNYCSPLKKELAYGRLFCFSFSLCTTAFQGNKKVKAF